MNLHRLLLPAAVAAGLAVAATPAAFGQIRVQDHVVLGADAAMRGFQESDFPRLHHIVDNLYVAEDLAGPIDTSLAFTTNAMFAITDDGVVVFDGFKDMTSTGLLIDMIAELTDQPIRYVVIGADHADHTRGNMAYVEANPNVVFITHPNASIPDAQRARVGLYVADSHALSVGGLDMEIMFLGRAHTADDLITYFPQYNIVWASEVWFNGLYPSSGGGLTAFPAEWRDMLYRLDALGADLILPNHGFIDSPAVLNAMWDEFLLLMDNLVDGGTALFEADVALDRATYSLNIGRFQYWYRAANNLHMMLLRLYGELGGEYEPYTVTERTPAVTMDGAPIGE